MKKELTSMQKTYKETGHDELACDLVIVKLQHKE